MTKALLFAALFASASAANAATVVQTFDANTIENSLISVIGFDGSLGTLNSVNFQFTGEVVGSLTLGPRPPFASAFASPSVATSSGLRFTGDIFGYSPAFGDFGSLGTNILLTGAVVLPFEHEFANMWAAPDASIYLAPTVEFDWLRRLYINGGVDGQYVTSSLVASSADFGISVTYDYTPNAAAVPEPSTWAMMLLGFGAVGFAMRRRRSIPQMA